MKLHVSKPTILPARVQGVTLSCVHRASRPNELLKQQAEHLIEALGERFASFQEALRSTSSPESGLFLSREDLIQLLPQETLPDLLQGLLIGREDYQVLAQKTGEGAKKQVYGGLLATSSQRVLPVAIHLLSLTKAQIDQGPLGEAHLLQEACEEVLFLQRLHQEQLALAVRHPVIMLHTFSTSMDHPLSKERTLCAFATDLMEGTLADLYHAPWNKKLLAISKAASALQSLHQRNLLSLDVKETNVLIQRGVSESDIQVLLNDWSSLTSDPTTQARLQGFEHLPAWLEKDCVVGTSSYIAPELQLYGARVGGTKAADVYSFGVMLWSLLSGGKRAPKESVFSEEDTAQAHRKTLLEAHQISWKKAVTTLPLSSTLKQLLLSCLHLDPRARPTMEKVSQVLREEVLDLTSKNET